MLCNSVPPTVHVAVLVVLTGLEACRPAGPQPALPKPPVATALHVCSWKPLEESLTRGELYHAARIAEDIDRRCLTGNDDRYRSLSALWYRIGDIEALGRLREAVHSDPSAAPATREDLSAKILRLQQEGTLDEGTIDTEDIIRRIRASRAANLHLEANALQSRALWALERSAAKRLGTTVHVTADLGADFSSPSRAHWSPYSDGPVVGNGIEMVVLDLQRSAIRWRFSTSDARLVDFALHPREPSVVSCWSDGFLRRWQLDSGQFAWQGLHAGCRNLRYHQDTAQLAVLDTDGVHVLDGSTGHERARLAEACSAMTWDHHGAVLCARTTGQIIRWRPEHAAETLPGDWPKTTSIDFRPGVDQLAIQASSGSTLVDYPSMLPILSKRCGGCGCLSQHFAPDGTFVTMDWCEQGTAYRPGYGSDGVTWHMDAGPGISVRQNAITFAPEGLQLFFADGQGFYRGRAVGDDLQLDALPFSKIHLGGGLRGSRGGLWVASRSDEVFVPLGDSFRTAHLSTLDHGYLLDASADGRVLAFNDPAPTADRIHVLDRATGRRQVIEVPGSDCSAGPRLPGCLANWRKVLSADGSTLAILDSVGRGVRFWSIGTTQFGALSLPSKVIDLGLSADGSILVTYGEDGIRWWRRDATGDQSLGVAALHGFEARGKTVFAVSPDARKVVIAGWLNGKSTVSMVNLDRGLMWTVEEDATVTATAVDGAGKWLAWGTLDGRIFVRTLDAGTPVSMPQGHPGRVERISFADDPPLLVSEGARGDGLRLWNPADGSMVARMGFQARYAGGLRPDSSLAPPWFVVAPVQGNLLVEIHGTMSEHILNCRIGDRLYPWGLCDRLLLRRKLVARAVRGDESLRWPSPSDK